MTAALLTVRRGGAVRSETRCVCVSTTTNKTHVLLSLSLSLASAVDAGVTGMRSKGGAAAKQVTSGPVISVRCGLGVW